MGNKSMKKYSASVIISQKQISDQWPVKMPHAMPTFHVCTCSCSVYSTSKPLTANVPGKAVQDVPTVWTKITHERPGSDY